MNVKINVGKAEYDLPSKNTILDRKNVEVKNILVAVTKTKIDMADYAMRRIAY